MATRDEMNRLLSIPCPRCGTPAGKRCQVRIGKSTYTLSSLDGECHEARWRAALNVPARVLSDRVAYLQPRSVAASAGLPERPW